MHLSKIRGPDYCTFECEIQAHVDWSMAPIMAFLAAFGGEQTGEMAFRVRERKGKLVIVETR